MTEKGKQRLLYAVFLLAVLLCGILGKDKWYNICLSAVAVVYLLLLTDEMRVGYLLCIVYAAGYSVVAFFTKVYASAVFHAVFLLPTAVFRFFKSPKKGEVGKLSRKGWLWALLAAVAFTAGLYFLLAAIGDAHPLLDGAILAVSVLADLFMLGNYRELWFFNLFSSLLYVAMWTAEFIVSGSGIAFAGLQAVVSVINVKGIVGWTRSAKKYQKGEESPQEEENSGKEG